MRFQKNDIIFHNQRNYQCIVCDDELAIFAPFFIQADAQGDTFHSVNFSKLFAVSNNEDVEDNFKYEKVKHEKDSQ